MRINNVRAITAIAVAALLTSGASACTDNEPDLPEPVSPAPAPETPPPADLTTEEQQAVEEAQVVIEDFLAAYQDVLVEGLPAADQTIGRLPNLGAGVILDDVWNEIGDNFDNNRRADGQIEWTLLEVVQADLDHVIVRGENELHWPLVQVRYCADATAWQIVDKGTGQPTDPGEEQVTPQPGTRHPATFSAYYFDPIPDGDDPIWWIEEWENEEEQQC